MKRSLFGGLREGEMEGKAVAGVQKGPTGAGEGSFRVGVQGSVLSLSNGDPKRFLAHGSVAFHP